MQDYEQKCINETKQVLNRKEKYNDYKSNLNNQIEETKHIKEFKRKMAKDTYMELLNLEEEQERLERKLNEQKRNAMRQHLIKTIEDNKVKIARKKEELKEQKAYEQQKQKEENRKVEEDLERQRLEKINKKYEMKNEMKRQLDAQKKKAEDQYELDRLAQIEADKKNQE